MNVWGYTRKSTDRQEMSLDTQRGVIERVAEANRFEVAVWVEDPNVSGSVRLDQREGGRTMCAEVRAGDVIIVAALDRAFRSVADCSHMLDRWERLGVRLILGDFGSNLDIAEPMGKAMIQMMAVFAELERKITAARIREALANRKAIGQAHSRHPGYGFRWREHYDARLKKMVKHREPDPEERALMRELVKWRMDDHSWDQIRQHVVYTLKLRTKDHKAWSQSRLERAYLAELKLQIEEGRKTG